MSSVPAYSSKTAYAPHLQSTVSSSSSNNSNNSQVLMEFIKSLTSESSDTSTGGGLSGPIALSGYLSKMKRRQSKLAPIWNRRWFALDGRELKYFSSKQSTKPTAIIDLLSIESIRAFEQGDQGIHSFVLKAKHRSFMLRAETVGDMKRWVRGLREQKELWASKMEGNTLSMSSSTGSNHPAIGRRPKHYREEIIRPKTFLNPKEEIQTSDDTKASVRTKKKKKSKHIRSAGGSSSSQKTKVKKEKKRSKEEDLYRDNEEAGDDDDDGWSRQRVNKHTVKRMSNSWIENATPLHDIQSKVEQIHLPGSMDWDLE